MYFAVCDDEAVCREELVGRIEDYYGKLDVTCRTYDNGESLYQDIKNGAVFDGVFLDIEMPGMDGIMTARRIRTISSVYILFLTSHTEFAMEGYEVAAFRFLGKPVDQKKLEQALADIREQIYGGRRILLKQGGEEYAVPARDILYMEADNNSVCFVCEEERITMRMKLKDVFSLLGDEAVCFCQVHRGYIVNLAHVKKYTAKVICLSNGEVVLISKSYLRTFKEQMLTYVRSNAR